MQRKCILSGPDKVPEKILWCHGLLRIKTLFNLKKIIGKYSFKGVDVHDIRRPENEYEQGLNLCLFYKTIEICTAVCMIQFGSNINLIAPSVANIVVYPSN